MSPRGAPLSHLGSPLSPQSQLDGSFGVVNPKLRHSVSFGQVEGDNYFEFTDMDKFRRKFGYNDYSKVNAVNGVDYRATSSVDFHEENNNYQELDVILDMPETTRNEKLSFFRSKSLRKF